MKTLIQLILFTVFCHIAGAVILLCNQAVNFYQINNEKALHLIPEMLLLFLGCIAITYLAYKVEEANNENRM